MLATLPRTPLRPSRRGFLKSGALAAVGLTLGIHVPTGRLTSALAAEALPGPFHGYLTIGLDGTVTVRAAHMDMGQGIYTGTATLVAEELDADWAQMRVEGGWGNPKLFGNLAWGGEIQGTGGSTGTASSFLRYRQAGAAARAMLIEAAARTWGVPTDGITVESGVVRHPHGKQASFAELAPKAALMPVPAEVRLKDPSQWRYIGNPDLRRLDSVAKTSGTQAFTIDVRLPGMLTAVVAHPPRFGATVAGFDATAAHAVKGVVDVVQIPTGVAVVAETTWAALKGREALAVTWDEHAAETRGTAELTELYRSLLDADGAAVARAEGDAAAAIAGAAKVVTADYEFPYLAHAALEPLDAVARRHLGKIEVWGGHQMPDLYQYLAAQTAGVEPKDVVLHVMMTGGGFGRRAVTDGDVIVEAVATARAIGWKAPVKLLWTREDDMKGGRYRPMYLHRLEAGLDAEGRIVGWRHRIVGQSILRGTPFEGFLVQNGVDATSVEGASNLPYAIPDLVVDLHSPDVGVPVLWWRAVGSTHTAYATEAFIDELAEAAGQDPLAFRLAMLEGHPRHRAVLELAAERAGWATPPPEGRARGIAVAESFGSYVAQVAEVSVEGGTVRVHRVVCAVDCGVAVNPDVIKAQMEGGIGFGLGAILKGQITLDAGRVEQGNFDGYPVLTIDEMPAVEVHIVASMEPPTGVGEPGVPPIGPAVANAVAAATGKRIRVLPFSRNDLASA